MSFAVSRSLVPFSRDAIGPQEPSGTIYSDFQLFRFAKIRLACPLVGSPPLAIERRQV